MNVRIFRKIAFLFLALLLIGTCAFACSLTKYIENATGISLTKPTVKGEGAGILGGPVAAEVRHVNGFLIEVHDDTAKILEYNQMPPWRYDENADVTFDLVLPEKIDGLTVTSLGRAFLSPVWYADGGTDIIVLPKTLQTIDPGAFDGTWGDFSIRLADGNPHLCYENGMLMNTARTELLYCAEPDISAYLKNNNLEEVVLPGTIRHIQEGACGFCDLCVIPPSVTQIDEGAFAYQNSSYVVRCDVRLQDPAQTKNYVFDDGMLFNTDKTVLINCNDTQQDVLSVPNGVVRVGKSAATGLGVQRLEIPASVVTIGEKAFADIGNLDDLVLSEGVKEIEAGAFFDSGLKTIMLPDSVTRIGDDAFATRAGTIESVTLPEKLQYLGENAFGYGYSLSALNLPASLEVLGGMPCDFDPMANKPIIRGFPTKGVILKDGFVLSAAGTVLYGSLLNDRELSQGKLVVPNGVEKIQTLNSLLYGTNDITEVTLPSSLTEIGDYAFSGYPEKEQLNLGGNLQKIGRFAFRYGAMHSLIIEEGVREIGAYAFEGCRMERVELPSSLRFVADYAFKDCSNLKTVVLQEGVTQIGYAAFMGCDDLSDIYIPQSVTQIDDYVFLPDMAEEVRPVIHCEKDSYAYRYALENGYECVFDLTGEAADDTDRVICNNERLSDKDAIRQIAAFLIFAREYEDTVITPDMLTFTDCIYILRTMLVHTDAIIDKRVTFSPPVISIDDATANEYIRLLFGRDIPKVDEYYVLKPGDSTDSEYGWRDGAYYFGTGWWNVGKFNYGDGDVAAIVKNGDGTISADIVFHPRDWMDTHIVMTLKPADTAFRFQIVSFETTEIDTSEYEN